MIAFATGGLLGDVFFHLIPHSFMGAAGEDPAAAAAGLVDPEAVRLIMVEEKRNVIIGGAVFAGFFAFFFLDKTMRVLSAGSGENLNKGHSHHHHNHPNTASEYRPEEATSTAVEPTSSKEGLRSRGKTVETENEVSQVVVSKSQPTGGASLKLSAYLNLFGDFSEIADYSILIKSGFTKRQAMASQFLTAVGAFVGTFLGIWIAESAGAASASMNKGIDLTAVVAGKGMGFLGTSVQPSDLVIPATAGGFLYIASVSVIPELLEESRSMTQAIKEPRNIENTTNSRTSHRNSCGRMEVPTGIRHRHVARKLSTSTLSSPPSSNDTTSTAQSDFTTHTYTSLKPRTILLLCIAFRAAVALLGQKTFFQPDEFYQSLEPAHRLVWGTGFETWEWRGSSAERLEVHDTQLLDSESHAADANLPINQEIRAADFRDHDRKSQLRYYIQESPFWSQVLLGRSSRSSIPDDGSTGRGIDGMLRSWIWPLLFALPYWLLKVLNLDNYGQLLVLAPRLPMILFAALTDFYTYRLAGRILGKSYREAARPALRS
ncbi:hypothetical protein QFC19_005007 [Naganishia cerealis]|uniref:Uncharacterized protein n=1 Tax=Naganishia cerealis TaxID=610337 RepID=A0ACC2VT11_9TREE|nr:hypothetical protein QFC19_005007 [Naganishia cerealis]